MKKRNVMLLVMLLVIGFAAVSTTLVFNGTIGIASNKNDFDVIFTDALVDGDRAKSTISEDKKSIIFSSNKITEVGETSVLEYKVKNNSTQYDADVTITCNTTGNEYVSINGEFDGKDIPLTDPVKMEAQEVKNGSITAELIKAYSAEDSSISVECKIVASASEKDEVTDYTQDIYKEDILNGTDPVLMSNKVVLGQESQVSSSKVRSANNVAELIPITLASDGTVTYADITEKWYSYENKEWANAIILKDTYDKLNSEGKLHGATKEDGYVSLDGVDDYIDLGYTNYDFSNGVTLAVDFTLNSMDGFSRIAGNWESAGFGIDVSNEGNTIAEVYVNGNWEQVLLDNIVKTGERITLVLTYDGDNLKLYANGKKVGEKAVTGTIGISKCSVIIGGNPDGNTVTGLTNLDFYSSAIYTRALSEDEIRNSFSNSIKIKDITGLLDYKNFTNKRSVGEIILEDDIESYFVWIPKYRYKLFDMGNYDSAIEGEPESSNAKTIEIEFNAKDTTDREGVSCVTPMESGASGNCEVGEWMTHPAFISMGTTGLWVGKFETGYEGATTVEEAEVNEINASKVIVKPNVYSWRSNTIANMFKTAYNYNRELDSHMMKNTEWGAVAYLSHSKYGINREINKNNNSDRITGFSATDDTDQSNFPGETGTDSSKTLPYNTEVGYKASTTGNITGIYDIVGGSWEFVSAYIDEKTGLSGFTISEIEENRKYFDVYSNDSAKTTYRNRILGDATGEIGPFYYFPEKSGNKSYQNSWYSSYSYFIDEAYPWFSRGGNAIDGLRSGLFHFGRENGEIKNSGTIRLVLAP